MEAYAQEDGLHQVLETAPKPVEFLYHQHVGLAQGRRCFVQTRPRHLGAADLVLEDRVATGGFQGIFLQVQVLIECRNACVANK